MDARVALPLRQRNGSGCYTGVGHHRRPPSPQVVKKGSAGLRRAPSSLTGASGGARATGPRPSPPDTSPAQTRAPRGQSRGPPVLNELFETGEPGTDLGDVAVRLR